MKVSNERHRKAIRMPRKCCKFEKLSGRGMDFKLTVKISSAHEMCKNSLVKLNLPKFFKKNFFFFMIGRLFLSFGRLIEDLFSPHTRKKQEATKYFSLCSDLQTREKSKFNSYKKIFHVGVASAHTHKHTTPLSQ